MSLLAWNDLFSVGVQEIDSQHKKLLAIANRLNDAMRHNQERETLAEILNDLRGYTETHFAFEERLMDQHAYILSAQHKLEHQKLVQIVVEFQGKFNRGDADLTSEMMILLRDWLSRHIMNSDKSFGRALNARGVH